MLKKILWLFLISSYFAAGFSQDTTKSLAFKKNKPLRKTSFFYQPDVSYQLWQQFKLLQEANSGNPFAQHELGIRYLLGEGVVADTLKGSMWIKKAAESDLTSALYNYGILLMNGWGVDWDPFKAYDYFLKAAQAGMPQSQYIVGLFNTENLIVKRNWNEAYKWINKSAKNDYQPAEKSLEEIKKKVNLSSLDTTNINGEDKNDFSDNQDKSVSSSIGLVFIDFDTQTDSITEITDEMLLEDLLLTENEEIIEAISDTAKVLKFKSLSNSTLPPLSSVLKLAEAGSPEALSVLGRLYQKGIYYPKDIVISISYLIRAIRYDSRTASVMLWNLLKDENIYDEIVNEVNNNNPEAMFVWYGLYNFGFENKLMENDALNLLTKAASQNHLPSVIELGLLYYTGKIVQKDKEKAIEIWKEAERLGSTDAKIRLAAAKIYDGIDMKNIDKTISFLKEKVEQGSLLSEVILAYCYENGIGVNLEKPEAVKYYRLAAQRGSQFAYDELKRMYDEIRPSNGKFGLN